MPADEADYGNLRPLLDAEEQFARSIPPGDPRAAIAREMLTVVADARSRLKPSADSTANYVPNKEIVEKLSALRAQADRLARGPSK